MLGEEEVMSMGVVGLSSAVVEVGEGLAVVVVVVVVVGAGGGFVDVVVGTAFLEKLLSKCSAT